MIRHLNREGYVLRCRIYSKVDSPEALLDEDADEDEMETVSMAWRFVHHYKSQCTSGFIVV